MDSERTGQNAGGGDVVVELLLGASRVSAEAWDGCAGSQDPFVSHAFFTALEESGAASGRSGWLPFHLAVRDRTRGPLEPGRLAGIVPLYVKNHSHGDYLSDQTWAEAFLRAGHAYYPKLQVGVPFTPVTGSRLLVRPDADPRVRGMLIRTLEDIARKQKVSSIHATFLPEAEARALEQAGWLLRISLDYVWHNNGYTDFAEFLAALTPPHCRAIGRERQDAAESGAPVLVVAGADIRAEHWDALHRLYAGTPASEREHPLLGREVVQRLGDALAPHALVILAGTPGAWRAAALHIVGERALYGRLWGCLEADRALLAEVCYYRPMEEAMARGLARVEGGPRGEQKIARGYTPEAVWSAHWIRKCGFRDTLAEHLAREREQAVALITALNENSPYHEAPGPRG